MNIKKISIIVVSLNTVDSFIKTIDSITSQTNQNYEIIVIDGGSTDGTIEEIAKRKKFFSFYSIEKDDGIYDAMNKGIDHIKTDWTIFLNSGDVFYNNHILNKIINLCVLKNDIIFSNTIVNNSNLKYVVTSKQFNKNTIVMPFCHQSSIVKTSLLKSYKFNTKYSLSSDFNFFLECFIQGNNFLYFNNIISIVKSEGISDNQRQKVFSENLEILNKKNKNIISLLIYILMLREFLVSSIKFFLPKKIIRIVFQLKYRNRIIK